MGSNPFDTVFLLLSPELIPTSLPGLFDVGIGNNFASLFLVGQFQIDPLKGWAQVNIPGSVPSGTKIHVQGVVLSFVLPSFPLEASNIESGTVLF